MQISTHSPPWLYCTRRSYGATPLHISAFNGNYDCLSTLLSWGADVNRATSEGCTALHYAAYMGRPSCVTLLLRMGCDPYIR